VDAAVVARVLALPEVAGARVVLVYWPVVRRGEVDVRPLAAALAGRGVTVALPVVGPGPGPRLDARRFTGETDLVAGPWGLFEPGPYAAPVDPDEIDVAVVPALAAARDGGRLGYGGGYYDAFLPTTRAFRVAVVPHACLVDTLPTEPHDARLDAVATERETARVPPGGAGPSVA
jgi:5-formyltetrahydrofolate cyclo-ligase